MHKHHLPVQVPQALDIVDDGLGIPAPHCRIISRQLHKMPRRAALSALHQLGREVKEGERVIICSHNCISAIQREGSDVSLRIRRLGLFASFRIQSHQDILCGYPYPIFVGHNMERHRRGKPSGLRHFFYIHYGED